MLKFIDFKKLTITTAIAVLLAGSLRTKLGMENALASQDEKSRQENNRDIVINLSADTDNNGISDKDELDGDFDGDGIANYLDLDDDDDNIADVMELHTLDQISNTGTKDMAIPETTATITLPNPPAKKIKDHEAINTDGTDQPNYRDIDSDNDYITDAEEAGDKNLHNAPVNTDELSDNPDNVPDYLDHDSDGDNISDVQEAGDLNLGTAPKNSDLKSRFGDKIADFQDFDSDNNSIRDIDEYQKDIDSDGIANHQDDDDDGDNIPDIIEIGSKSSDSKHKLFSSSPLDSDQNPEDGYDFQDTDSDDDQLSDRQEGIQSVSSTGTSGANVTIMPGNNGTITIIETMTNLKHQIPDR